MTVTRAGVPVAELRAVPRPPLAASTLLARWHRLPVVDPEALRADIDAALDPSL